MARSRKSPLARLARLSKYLVEDAGGILADVGYAVRNAVSRRRQRRATRRRERETNGRGHA